jgi:hypothetical protein
VLPGSRLLDMRRVYCAGQVESGFRESVYNGDAQGRRKAVGCWAYAACGAYAASTVLASLEAALLETVATTGTA